MLFRRFVALVLFVLCISVVQAQAIQYEKIKEDFKPLSGYMIMSTGDEYLIDLGATQEIRIGDLFAVISEGQEIVHPVSNKVLGTLNELKGLLKVTRVEKDYSFATRISGEKYLVRGDVVKRYSELSAAFMDYTDSGETVYAQLVELLPGLKWAQYKKAKDTSTDYSQSPTEAAYNLIFVSNHDALQARNADSQLVKSYPRSATLDSQKMAHGDQLSQPPLTAALVKLPREQTVPVTWEKSGSHNGGGFNVSFPGFSNLGPLPDGTIMADFIDAKGLTLIATTDGSDIRIFTLEKNLQELTRGDTKSPAKILSIHWWQPTPNDDLYLALTITIDLNQAGMTYSSQKAVGAIFRLSGNQLVSINEQLPYMLGTFDQDGDGRKETLLGQEFDRDVFFGDVKELRLVNGQFKGQDPSVQLPRNFTVQGSLITDLSGDGRPEVAWVQNRVLNIVSTGKEVYASAEEMGGTLSQMSYDTNPGYKESSMSTAAFEVPPVVHDLDGDGINELLTIASEGDFFTAPGIGPGIKKSWLAVLKYREGMFLKGSVGDELDLPLQGLHVTAEMIYFVATSPSNWLGKSGKSHLLAFPLAK